MNLKTGDRVLVRTYSAGVHFGEVVLQEGQTIALKNARRLWRWSGANTLHEISLRGVSEDYTRISEPVDDIILMQVIEILILKPAAWKNLNNSRWGK